MYIKYILTHPIQYQSPFIRYLTKKGIKINHDGKKRSLIELLSFSNISFSKLEHIWPEIKKIDSDTKEQIEIEAVYLGYLDRQRAEVEDYKKEGGLKIPKSINYKKVGSLSNEVVEKLTNLRPQTLGAASRISGITPAAIIILLSHIKKHKFKASA